MRALEPAGHAIGAAPVTACSKPLPDALQLDGPPLTVNNQTTTDWTNVEVWLKIRLSQHAGERLAVDGEATGRPLEIKKPFARGGLAGVFGGTS
jgi:hypothetical protein